MKEVLLCKYGELILKGANKSVFEDALCKELRIRSKHFGHFTVDRAQSTIYVTPVGDDYDMDGMLEAAGRVFGISALCRAAACEKNMEAIRQTIRDYLPPFMKSRRTFKVEAKRSDKTFPLDSMEIAAQAGGMVLETCPWLTVDVHTPDVVVKIEIRENEAYVHAGQFPGAGGMPFGSAGTGLLLLSGGIRRLRALPSSLPGTAAIPARRSRRSARSAGAPRVRGSTRSGLRAVPAPAKGFAKAPRSLPASYRI